MTGGGTLGVVGGALPEGSWALDASHFPKPVSRATAALLVGRLSAEACERWGLPQRSVDFAVDDDGWVFVRDQLLDDPDEIRRRAPAAAETVRTRRWRAELERWTTTTRPALVAELLALQDEPLPTLDDRDLADHVERAAATARRALDLHMELHLTDMAPLGLLLVAAATEGGLGPGEVVALMAGASPASAPSPELVAARAAAAGPGAAEAGGWRGLPEVRAFLRLEGHHLVSEPEVASATLHERPDLVESLVLGPAATTAAAVDPPPPCDERFADLLADARLTYGLRDDNTRLTAMWPLGLVRRAYREAAARLALGAGHDDAVFGLEPGELADALRLPAARPELMARGRDRQERRRRAEASGRRPDGVGEWTPADPALLSADQQLLQDALDAYGGHYGGAGPEPLVGIGIAGPPTTGPAVVATGPLDALDRLEPGRSVLVVTATAPAYDAVLPLVAGLVVETGGLLCHAALAGRQLGLPVVVGVTGATSLICDGDEVTLDPGTGRVTVRAISRPGSSSPRR
jgi:rifampicin phosphotransferase